MKKSYRVKISFVHGTWMFPLNAILYEDNLSPETLVALEKKGLIVELPATTQELQQLIEVINHRETSVEAEPLIIKKRKNSKKP